MNKRTAAFVLLLTALLGFMGAQAHNAGTRETPPGLTAVNCQQTSQCFTFTYKGNQLSLDGKQVTLSFSVKNNCTRDLGYVSFELPAGGTATALPGAGYTYTTAITNNPFRALKFEGVNINGFKNGGSDDFQYTISKQAFDQLTNIRVQAKAGPTTGLVTFNKICAETQCTAVDGFLSGVRYSSPGTAPNTNLVNTVKQGQSLKVCFDVKAEAGTGFKTYTFASYKAPFPRYSEEEANKQVLFDYKTIVVGPAGGQFCLEIAVPDCYYQVDFVRGCVIEKLGPAGTDNFYGKQGRLIAAANGGTKPCVPDETTGNEGCTPGYWKQEQHFGSWAPLVPTGANATKFFNVFTVCDQNGNNCSYRNLPPDLTLLQALELKGGDFEALARHAAAAYLNATSNAVAYSIKKVDIVTNVIDAFMSNDPSYKNVLENANEKYCPLGRAELTTSNIQASGKEAPALVAENSLSATPNPFTGKTNIRFTLVHEGRYAVGLFDTQGKMVRNLKTGTGKAGETQQVLLEATGLHRGMYLVQLLNGAHTKTIKVVVQQ